MSVRANPYIETNGLVFCYDMNNTKSWQGAPTTNQFTLPTADVNGFGVQNSTFTRIRTGMYGGYDIKPTDYVWRYNISGNDCPYHGWDIPTPSGSVVTFSFDYFVDLSCVNYPSNNYLANFENAGSGVGGAYGDPTPSIKGVWKRAYFTSTATATGNSRCLLYPGACGTRLADSGFILYKNPQVEFNAPGGIPTPFVAGSRSATQAVLDLTNNNVVTVNALTYNSDGTFSINNIAASSLSIPDSSITRPTSLTISAWVRMNVYNPLNDFDGSYPTIAWKCNSDNSGGGGSYGLSLAAPNPRFAVSSTQLISASPLTYGVWVNLVGTYSAGGAMVLYRNGVVDASTTGPASIPYSAQVFSVGSRIFSGVYQYPWNGSIGLVKLYNRALTSSEVRQNFNSIKGRYGL
jgi:hypothetical protein